MSDTPETDAIREVIIGQYKEDELTGNGMGNILSALTDFETLEHDRNGWKTAHDVLQKLLGDTIKQRDEARGQLSTERALADRLAGVLELYYADDTIAHGAGIANALTAWKEVRGE